MTIDGSEDDHIKVQGLTEKHTFTDADGGAEGGESDSSEDEDELADVPLVERVYMHADQYMREDSSSEDEENEADEEVEAEDGMEDSDWDDIDDTAERIDACGEAPSIPPPGYRYAPCPPLATEDEQRSLKGRKILAAHLLNGATGWYMGTVQAFGVGAAWKQPDATHIVIYKQAETKSKELVGRVACKLTAESYGASEWWLLLEPQV